MNTKEFVKIEMERVVEIANKHQKTFGENYADEKLVYFASTAMAEKLKISRAKGMVGWWRKNCEIEDLESLLDEHVKKGDMVDVMNISAMIYAKQCFDS